MNLSAPPPSAPARATPIHDKASCRRDEAPAQDARGNFERALQARRQAPRDEPETRSVAEAMAAAAATAAAAAAAPTAATSMGPAPALVRALATPADAGGAGSCDTPTGATRTATQTALNAQPAPPATPLGGADPAVVWEASLRGPDQMAVEVRAERLGKPDAAPSWGLTIGASALNAELLARHAPRLNERLRKHGVEVDHVRIESADPDARR